MSADHGPTPRQMLAHYRQHSPVDVNEQARLFGLLPASDRMELLFYMLLNINKAFHEFHDKMNPEEKGVFVPTLSDDKGH